MKAESLSLDDPEVNSYRIKCIREGLVSSFGLDVARCIAEFLPAVTPEEWVQKNSSRHNYTPLPEPFLDRNLIEICGDIWDHHLWIAPRELGLPFINDPEFYLETMHNVPRCLSILTEDVLKQERGEELMRSILKKCLIHFVPASLYGRFRTTMPRELWMEFIQSHKGSLKYAPDYIRSDREVVLAAVRRRGCELDYAPGQLKKDREVVLAAVGQKGLALEHASEELQNDREVVLAAVKQDGGVLKSVSDKFKNDREVILAAVKQDPTTVVHASIEIRLDFDFLIELVVQVPKALRFIGVEFRVDESFNRKVIARNPECREYALSCFH